MWSLLKSRTLRGLMALEALPLALSMLIAENFFKFHSFLLESIAFLIVWCALGWLHAAIMARLHQVTKLVPNPEIYR